MDWDKAVEKVEDLDDDALWTFMHAHLRVSVPNDEVWVVLSDPRCAHRVDNILRDKYQRVEQDMKAKRIANDVAHQACLAKGSAGRKEWFPIRTEYEQWKSRAASFKNALNHRRAAIKRAVIEQARQEADERDKSDASRFRSYLHMLAIAIAKQQGEAAAGDRPITQADRELWDLLDQLTIPDGPDQHQVSLRRMLMSQWWGVTPSAPADGVAASERTMRQAPGGRGPAYGTPRARRAAPPNTLGGGG